MSQELDIIYNNYLIEENKNKEYLDNVQTIYICMYVIYYNMFISFYFIEFFFQSRNDHKFKIKIK